MLRFRLLAPLGTAVLATTLVGCDRTPSKKAPAQTNKEAPQEDHAAKPEAKKKAEDAKNQAKAGEKPSEYKKEGKPAGYEEKKVAEKIDIKFKAPYDQEPELKTTFKNGLAYEDFVIGEGIPARKGSRLAIHYTGYLLNGKVFDSSVEQKRPPFLFELGQGRVIKGWEQGLVGMKKGGKRKLIIPADLAYGATSRGQIPSNSKLIFTLEMMDVRPPIPAPKDASAFKGRPVSRKRLKNGLRITDYALGEGEAAEKGDTVLVHYTGKLKNGTVFDSSVEQGRRHFSFSLGAGRVIKGWDEGIEGMKVGGLRHLKIPPALGYGDRNMGNGRIPPNSTLEFTVELMDVIKPAKPKEEEKKEEEKKAEGDKKPEADKKAEADKKPEAEKKPGAQ